MSEASESWPNTVTLGSPEKTLSRSFRDPPKPSTPGVGFGLRAPELPHPKPPAIKAFFLRVSGLGFWVLG